MQIQPQHLSTNDNKKQETANLPKTHLGINSTEHLPVSVHPAQLPGERTKVGCLQKEVLYKSFNIERLGTLKEQEIFPS